MRNILCLQGKLTAHPGAGHVRPEVDDLFEIFCHIHAV